MKFLEEIKNLKRGNRAVFTSEDLVLIDRFGALGSNEFMEQKEITRLGKLLDRAVLLLVPKSENGIRLSVYTHTFRTGRLEKELKSYLDTTYEYYQFKHTPATEAQMNDIKKILEIGNLISPISDKFKQVSEKQWMRNGKIPKTLQKNVSVEDAVRGKLCAEFATMVTILVSEFEEKQRAYYAEIKSTGVLIANITARVINKTVGGETTSHLEELDDAKKDENINFVIESSKTALTGRLVKKLGGFDLKSKVDNATATIRSHNHFHIFVLLKNGDKFTMIGKSVLNYSPLGTPFMQFPITFHDMISGGEKIENSECKFKKAFSI